MKRAIQRGSWAKLFLCLVSFFLFFLGYFVLGFDLPIIEPKIDSFGSVKNVTDDITVTSFIETHKNDHKRSRCHTKRQQCQISFLFLFCFFSSDKHLCLLQGAVRYYRKCTAAVIRVTNNGAFSGIFFSKVPALQQVTQYFKLRRNTKVHKDNKCLQYV